MTIREALRELDLWGAAAVFNLTEYTDSSRRTLTLIKDWKDVVNQVNAPTNNHNTETWTVPLSGCRTVYSANFLTVGCSAQRTNAGLLAELSSVLKVCCVSAFTPTLCPSRWEITAACCSPSKTLPTTAASRTRSGHWLAAVNTFSHLCCLHYGFQSPCDTKLNVLLLAASGGKYIRHKDS